MFRDRKRIRIFFVVVSDKQWIEHARKTAHKKFFANDHIPKCLYSLGPVLEADKFCSTKWMLIAKLP